MGDRADLALERIANALEKLVELKTVKRTTAIVKPVTKDRWESFLMKWKDFTDDPDFIKEEIKKANLWIEANPRRKPKDKIKFLQNWFTKAWERHRKTIPTNNAKTSYDFLK